MAHQADHLAGLDAKVDVAQDGAVAIAEAQLFDLDLAFDLGQLLWLAGFWHAGNMVEDVKNPFGTGGSFLCYRHNAAHRVQPQIKAADIG